MTCLPLRKVRWVSLFNRAVVATTGHSSLIPLSCWMAVMRFLGALGAYSKQGLGVSLQNFSTSQRALLVSLRRLQLILSLYSLYFFILFSKTP